MECKTKLWPDEKRVDAHRLPQFRSAEVRRYCPAQGLIWKQVGEGHRWMYWDCDFPMMAMTAARLGKPETVPDALLADHPNNVVLANGFSTAGFPDDGSWVANWEGLKKAQ